MRLARATFQELIRNWFRQLGRQIIFKKIEAQINNSIILKDETIIALSNRLAALEGTESGINANRYSESRPLCRLGPLKTRLSCHRR